MNQFQACDAPMVDCAVNQLLTSDMATTVNGMNGCCKRQPYQLGDGCWLHIGAIGQLISVAVSQLAASDSLMVAAIGQWISVATSQLAVSDAMMVSN